MSEKFDRQLLPLADVICPNQTEVKTKYETERQRRKQNIRQMFSFFRRKFFADFQLKRSTMRVVQRKNFWNSDRKFRSLRWAKTERLSCRMKRIVNTCPLKRIRSSLIQQVPVIRSLVHWRCFSLECRIYRWKKKSFEHVEWRVNQWRKKEHKRVILDKTNYILIYLLNDCDIFWKTRRLSLYLSCRSMSMWCVLLWS